MNKPVAWMETANGKPKALAWVKEALIDAIPLYTHPVKEHTTTLMESREKIFLNESHPVKELTDEEIEAVMYKCDWSYDPVSFAKAILRKAQEK